jgi:hypothetical protein
MKKILYCSLALFAVSVLASPGMAEFYRYKDAHGNVIYTDDLSKVPTEQRSQAEMYEESETEPTPRQTQEVKAAEPGSGGQIADSDAIRKEGERLLKLKDELDNEYNALLKENADLKTEQQAAVTPEQIKAVNQKVISYNARFQAYREKSAAYESDVKKFHEQTKAAEAQQKSGSGTN